jgi:hypothetical protein
MMHRASLVVALSLSACGLERDWERWQQVAQSATEDVSSGGTSTAAPEDSSSSSAGPAGLDSSEGAASASDDASGTTLADASTSTAETSTATGTTSDAQPFCGDGHVDLDLQEECDDGEVVSDACVWCQRPRLIFLTSTLLKGGKIGGLMSADAYCRSLALKAQQEVPDSPIVDPTNFKALLSSSTESIFDRHFIGKGPYRLVNGLTVAESFVDLFNGTPLKNPINVNERSETMHTFVWTGTAVDGAPYPGITFCGDWSEVTGTANFGDSDSVDAGWIHFDIALNPDSDCYGNAPIYCAEQE